MIVKLLGLVDILTAAVLFLASTDIFGTRFILTVAAVLFIKAVAFVHDPVSKFDIIIAIYLAITLVHNINGLSILFGIYIGFKGIYSWF